MQSPRSTLAWLAAGAAGLLLLAWAYPRAFPFAPRGWEITRPEAVSIALERARDLGEPVADPYVVAQISPDAMLERRLQEALPRTGRAALDRTGLPGRVAVWEVLVYPRGALRDDWRYRAWVTLSGQVVALVLHLDEQARGAPISNAAARQRADAFLAEQGIDVARYEAPQFRSRQLDARTDLAVRYRDRMRFPAPGVAHGIQVHFAGDRLAGFSPWLDDAGERALQDIQQQASFAGVGSVVLLFLTAGLLALPFLKRYHEGEIGVRRGVQVFVLVFAAGLVGVLLSMRGDSQGLGFGFATREQTTWLWGLFVVLFMTIPSSLLAFFAWSVGESVCRERWGAKLAAFDALFQRQWANATVARSSLRGVAAGMLLAGGFVASFLPLSRLGAWPFATFLVAGSNSRLPGVELATSLLSTSLPVLLAVTLCLTALAVRRFGRFWGALAALVPATALLASPLLPIPLEWGLVPALLYAAAVVLLFLSTDLLTVLMAGFVSDVLLLGYPFLTAADGELKVQGWLALGVAAAPLLASIRYLGSGREFTYRYEDVPPHVRRIAERERQRVELETARRIQSSILPELPPSLNGVEIAHAYLPATEVGGDFYDVLALADGRLALAVGDVAGHGVSSGLVMSMAKSALAVQVTFDPDVEAVFNTLNRTVFQTARKRLLATLCYALLDPKRRELLYASAGHLFPYVISARGGVHALESVAYPLGVRGEIQVTPRRASLDPGDILFLFSDGIVEARREDSTEEFGFERLEQSLARHAGEGVERLRDGVLADVTRYTANAPREDDQTILVLRLPAA